MNQILKTTLLLKFPLGKTGGLIEAPLPGHAPGCRRQSFPLGKTGGLIEAWTRRCSGTSPATSFRWVKPAASLKRSLMGSNK